VQLETASSETINSDSPATCSPTVQDALETAAAAVVSPAQVMRLVSRAYHDSLFMSKVAPTGMLFVPCAHGFSHRPDEFASGEDMANGVRVLAIAMATLASCDMSGSADVARTEL
jgi:ureidoglycolate amidohydrolase